MKRIEGVLEIYYKKLTKEDYDSVILISGDEGKGKSNVALHILDWWLTKKNGEVKEEDIKHINLDSEQFTEDLKNCERFDCTVYDEAGNNDGTIHGAILAH